MRVSVNRSQLVIIDVQEKLAPAIFESRQLVERIAIIKDTAGKLSVPALFTEHYPMRIGPTLASLTSQTDSTIKKTTFSACLQPEFQDAVANNARDQIIICGMEAHVCVMQTALDLLTTDKEVSTRYHIVMIADAVGSRRAFDRDMALNRLRDAGATIATTEMLLFEWLENGDHPQFRSILRMIKNLA